jgi:hypothetical protein
MKYTLEDHGIEDYTDVAATTKGTVTFRDADFCEVNSVVNCNVKPNMELKVYTIYAYDEKTII